MQEALKFSTIELMQFKFGLLKKYDKYVIINTTLITNKSSNEGEINRCMK